MKTYLLFSFVAAVCFFSCSDNRGKIRTTSAFVPQNLLDSNGHKKNFDSLLAIVCKDTFGLDFSEELISKPKFSNNLRAQ